MVDLAALRALEAVHRTGTVTAAAAELHLTPSAISHQIKRLERRLEAPLLERVGRLVVLTGEATRLLDRTGPLLEQLDQAMAAGSLDGSQTPRGVVRIGSFGTAITGGLAAVLAAAVRDAPELDLRLTEREPLDALREVATGVLELAVVHHWALRPYPVPDHVTAFGLQRDIADVLVGPGDQLARRRTVRPDELVDRRWVSTGVGTLCHDWLQALLGAVDRSPDIVHWSPDYAVHIELVRAGLATAVVPRLGRPPLPADVRAVEVRGAQPVRQVELLVRASQLRQPTLGYLIDRIRTGFGR